jgi:UDP-N-acetylmuramoylalanine--D-glutamate ligase
MAGDIAGSVRWAAVIGATAHAISDELEKEGIQVVIYGSLEEAFNGALKHAREGDVLLLSPGCASYDMFRNFEERGECFKAIVRRYMEEI